MKILALLLIAATTLPAQEFEVATIRPAKDDGHHDSNGSNGRWTTHNLTLKSLTAMAWDVDQSIVMGGPNWIDSDSYDIKAKIPDEYVKGTRDQRLQMMRSLFADRFQLAVHRETREISGYALVTARTGSKMAVAKPGGNGSGFHGHNTNLKATSVTMAAFAQILSRNRDVEKVVVDKTGLSGMFDFELDWAPAQQETADHPSLFTALQEQLGLKLESARVPVEAVIVDRAEKASEN